MLLESSNKLLVKYAKHGRPEYFRSFLGNPVQRIYQSFPSPAREGNLRSSPEPGNGENRLYPFLKTGNTKRENWISRLAS